MMIESFYTRLKYINSIIKDDSRSFKLEALIAFAVRVLGAGSAFIMSLVIARSLGADEAGYFLLTLSMVTFLSAVCRCGLDNVVLRVTSTAFPFNEKHLIVDVLKKGVTITFAFSGCVSILLWFSSNFISETIFDKPEISNVIKAVAPSVLAFSCLTLISMSLQGLRKIITSVTALNISVNLILILGLSILGIKAAAEVGKLYSFANFSALISFLVIWVKIVQPASLKNTDRLSWTSVIQPAFPLWLVLLLTQLNEWVGFFIASRFVSSAEIAQLAVAQRSALLASFILTAINIVIAPRFAELFRKNDNDGLRSLTLHAVRMVIVLSSPLLLAMLLFPSDVMNLFGDGFVNGGHLLQILAVGQFVNLSTGSVGFLLIMSGHEKDLRNTLLLVTPVTIILSIWLVPEFGATGAAIGAALGGTLQNLLSVYWVKKRLGFNTLLFWKK